jgi:predicted ArsR family transcriptional regulator
MLEDTFKSTRERVLQTLQKKHRCTINELAEAVDINPISVRHHISKLQADGLVGSEEERHGVGRPRQLYFLTEAGLEHFPTRYMRLAIRILEQLKEQVPAETVSLLFTQMAADLVEEYADPAKTRGLSTEQRLNLVKGLLKGEGFEIEWERIGDNYYIRELSHTCMSDRITRGMLDRSNLISSVLNLPTEKVKCVLNGDNNCTYVVPNIVSDFIPTEKVS